MKKSIFPAVLALVIVAFLSFSCRSTPRDTGRAQAIDPPPQITPPPAQIIDPPPQITQPPAQIIDRPAEIIERPAEVTERPAEITEVPPQVIVDPLMVEARARAQAARQQAIDFETPNYFPSEWDAIEAQLRAANNAAAYNAAAAAYDELFRKTVPLYAQAREDEIMAARNELIHSGFAMYFPEYLREADYLACEALDQFEAGNYLLARDTAAQAFNDYEDMLLVTRAYLIREEIIDRGFELFDFNNFVNADNLAEAAWDEFETGNRVAARAHAQEAGLLYNTVLSNGWAAFARNSRMSASIERELALGERANIASRETFQEGDFIFNQAERLFASRNFHDSSLNHLESETMFAVSRIETRERRLRAEEAMRMADEAIGQSIETAMEAERVIEGGSR